MGDVLTKIFAVILIVILLFLFPLLDSFERMDDLSYMTVYSATVEFVDKIKNSGILTFSDYQNYENILNSTGNRYDVEMIHKKVRYNYNTDLETNYDENYTDLEEQYTTIYDEVYTDGIKEELGINEQPVINLFQEEMINNSIYFQKGDYFYISIKNKSFTPATLLKNMFYDNANNKYSIVLSYGGQIRNDTNTSNNEQILPISYTPQDVISIIQTTKGGLTGLIEMVNHCKELLENLYSDPNYYTDLSTIKDYSDEIDNLFIEYDRIVSTTYYNNIQVLSSNNSFQYGGISNFVALSSQTKYDLGLSNITIGKTDIQTLENALDKLNNYLDYLEECEIDVKNYIYSN